MNNPKLWIFGDSFSYPYNIEESTSWPVLLSKKLKAELVNFAQPAADNFFIFNSFYENYNKISFKMKFFCFSIIISVYLSS